MRIYRVEHGVSHHGPYAHHDHNNPEATARLKNALYINSLSAYKHPIPEEDTLLWPWCELPLKAQQEEYIFGFASLDQLLDWFDSLELRQHLRQEGFIIAQYETENVYIGSKQVIFHRSAIRINTEPIPEYETS